MLKKLLILFIAIAPMAVVAQNLRIAYINTNEIMSAMPELSGIQAQVAERHEQMRATIQVLETDYINRLSEFQALPENTSETIMQDRLRELQQLQERMQALLQSSEVELFQLWQTLIEPVHRRVSEAIQAVANEGGYTFVFDVGVEQSQLVFVSDNASNITQAVRTRLGI